MSIHEERSAGVVVFSENHIENLFLLLNYPSGHWDFIKGKIEQNETLQETTIRETREETGITDLEFIDGFEEKIEYNFQYDEKVIHKQVIFFLAKTKTRKINLSHEHLDYVWCNFKNAFEKVTFQNAKNVLLKANDLLETK